MSFGNRIRGSQQGVQKLLDENAQLIQAIVDYQNKGKAAECVQYQQLLHKNLMYLANLADSSQNIPSMIPPPPASNQVPSATPVSSPMGMPHGNVPSNVQERKVLMGTSMDQGSPGMPKMPSQVMSSAGSQIMTGSMNTVPSAMTPNDAGTNASYGGNINMSPQSTSTPPGTGYPGNVNQMMAPNMAATSQSMMPGQQQNYMPNIHATHMQQQQQGQQFMMRQAMSYNRPPTQMLPQQQMNQQQPYMANQAISGQSAQGMVPYQQPASSYDPYASMQQMNTAYNNPYGPP